jgi:hypothetical protein
VRFLARPLKRTSPKYKDPRQRLQQDGSGRKASKPVQAVLADHLNPVFFDLRVNIVVKNIA